MRRTRDRQDVGLQPGPVEILLLLLQVVERVRDVGSRPDHLQGTADVGEHFEGERLSVDEQVDRDRLEVLDLVSFYLLSVRFGSKK